MAEGEPVVIRSAPGDAGGGKRFLDVLWRGVDDDLTDALANLGGDQLIIGGDVLSRLGGAGQKLKGSVRRTQRPCWTWLMKVVSLPSRRSGPKLTGAEPNMSR